ncbi:MAG: DNA polymerase III subunit epsilon [Pseudomonadales bacterium]|nr:DNA polymerase III subunit epsilon [Pseudomonadales bacterium]
MRQIVLDTETTGIEIHTGNRLIEIGCVELVNRKLTGRHYHQYVNPHFKVEEGAFNVHGISNEFLADKPNFPDVMDEFMAFIDGAELVIHNAPFDVGFLNHELKLAGGRYGGLEDYCGILDTLAMARKKHPGARNTLDALCRRYGVDNGHRELHGALLDAEILADVYLLLTGGQTGLALGGDGDGDSEAEAIRPVNSALALPVFKAGSDELGLHESYMGFLDKKSAGKRVW